MKFYEVEHNGSIYSVIRDTKDDNFLFIPGRPTDWLPVKKIRFLFLVTWHGFWFVCDELDNIVIKHAS